MTDDVKVAIARRAAQELQAGEIVNLGIGIPNLVPGLLRADADVFLQTENGLLGVGPRPGEGEIDPDLIDASKQPVTALAGAAYFDSADSFAMIRGGHVDVAVLGALQVSIAGDIANWAVPGKDVLGVGGAMDLVVGARRVIVTMTASSSAGEPKIVAGVHVPADRARRGRRRHHRALRLPTSRRPARAHGVARGRDHRAGARRNRSIVRHRPGGTACSLRQRSPVSWTRL